MKQERHKYEYIVELDADSGPARVIRMVGRNKTVLEVGAGPGSITRLLASAAGCRVTAIDIDAESIERLGPYCERALRVDLNQNDWPAIVGEEKRFEVIIAADVLEHVYEPLAVLKAIKSLLSEDGGYLVASLPHIGHAVIHACLFEENFEYGESGLLDRTHIRFFGIRNMQKLFEDAGMKIVQAEFVVRDPAHTEFARLWHGTPRALRDAFSRNPLSSVYQVIVKAVPRQAQGEPLILMEIAVEPQEPSFRDSVKAFLRTHLSRKMYSKIQAIAARLGLTHKE